MTQLKHGTWVLIADSEKALFTHNVDDELNPTLDVIRMEEQDNPPNREQARHRRGRFNDGPSVHRSAVQDTDWHRLNKELFANELADILYEKAYKNEFHEIVLIAPPATLGELRKALHQVVTDKVIAEIPKLLTSHPLDEIETMVRNDLAAM
ncbi:baeRF12 domain-containing protein [Pontibaca salina]|uniref:Host attachment protein n=1 Tax=Pontibaca salina TaxID=2795731 RepID=A0A934LZZ3_9RHOB|nr:host attachment family protein [Pontibaca salina]MBI6629203.1 host attachment protein [Pontibaca salina]